MVVFDSHPVAAFSEEYLLLSFDLFLYLIPANSIGILSLADAIESAAISYESLSNSITERDGTRAFLHFNQGLMPYSIL